MRLCVCECLARADKKGEHFLCIRIFAANVEKKWQLRKKILIENSNVQCEDERSAEKWAIIESENACEPLAWILIFPTRLLWCCRPVESQD